MFNMAYRFSLLPLMLLVSSCQAREDLTVNASGQEAVDSPQVTLAQSDPTQTDRKKTYPRKIRISPPKLLEFQKDSVVKLSGEQLREIFHEKSITIYSNSPTMNPEQFAADKKYGAQMDRGMRFGTYRINEDMICVSFLGIEGEKCRIFLHDGVKFYEAYHNTPNLLSEIEIVEMER